MPSGIYNHKQHSPQTIEKIRLSNLGQKRTELTRENIGIAMKKSWATNPNWKNKGYTSTSEWMKKNNPMFKPEAKMKLKLSKLGAKNPNWKGGVSKENQLLRGRDEYRNWRKAVYQRDNWTCQKCFKRGIKIEAHHKQVFAGYTELRFNVENGLTLCKKCHKELHKNGNS